jgi:hypothetical protein
VAYELNFLQYEFVPARQNWFMSTHIRGSYVRFLSRRLWTILFVPTLLASFLFAAEAVEYPDNFRRWVHVGTGVILPGGPIPESEQGMHHIFANQKAVDGYASGNFAEGSVVVYELRQTQQQNGVIFEGERRRVDVMIKDSTPYGKTGGWRFERFWGNDQTEDAVRDSGASCFECHEKAKIHGFVISQLR